MQQKKANVSLIFQRRILFLLFSLTAAFSVCVSKTTPTFLTDKGVVFTCGYQEQQTSQHVLSCHMHSCSLSV